MKRDFSTQLKSLDGEPLVNQGKPFTLGAAVIGALMTPFDDEAHISGEQKFNRYNLAVKINAPSAAEVSAEEIAQMKLVVGKAYGPLVVGQVFNLLDADYEPAISLGDNFA